jgi:hypothetical protein
MIYDMIYDTYFTAIGLTLGGSSTAHIYTKQYTEYRKRNIHNNQKTWPPNLGSAGRVPSIIMPRRITILY